MFSGNLDEATLKAIYLKTILENPYIPYEPTGKQLEFLLNFKEEVLYGGAAGGGKSVAMLMAALMFVEMPDYSALILRRNYAQLTLPGALLDLSFQWLTPTAAKWNGQEKLWTFPSGATLNFGYLDSENDKYRYAGAAFHFVGFDELTQFMENQYTFLFSRMRKTTESVVPIRMRASSNPGGIGHEWVKERFIDTEQEEREFIPAKLTENPHLDQQSYTKSLSRLDPVTRKQLEEGDWDVLASGNFFKREKFEIVDDYPQKARSVRYWDLAGTAEAPGKDPDYTAGVKICVLNGRYWVIDVIRQRLAPAGVEALVKQTAQLDGYSVGICMEQEPGSSGKALIDHYARRVLQGYTFNPVKTTGSKIDRAKPFSSAVENGNVLLLSGAWNKAFIDECTTFPQKGFHDDQVDAASGAFEKLKTGYVIGNPENYIVGA